MVIVITVIHILVSLGLILVVLLQTGKGAEMGAVFGGSSATIFGSSGAGNFLTRLTSGMAIVFMMTSLALGYFAGHRTSSTIFENRSPAVEPRQATPPASPSKQEAAPGTGSQAPATPVAPQNTQSQKSKTP
jgi:preprotein translocase subunit SecG